jgi:ribonuclease VapC
MVIDSSAVIASLTADPDAPIYRAALKRADECAMSAFNSFETRIVLMRAYDVGLIRDFDALLSKLAVRVVPFGADQVVLAQDAYRRFGKGMGHPAQLNLGDCAAYALARQLGQSLLFKGDDFAKTDIASALFA